jgi:hypothetical protein
MNRLLATLVVAALLVVTLAIGVALWRRGQSPPAPSVPVGEQPQQQEVVSPHAPKWQQHRREK